MSLTSCRKHRPRPSCRTTARPSSPRSRAASTTAAATLLVEAYAAIWLVLMAWIFLLWRKQASLGERLDGLERTIDRAAAELEKKAARRGAKA